MSDRAQQLHATADGQIAELVDLVSGLSEQTLRLPCPSREKLGDGTVAASARHTADNYQRIAEFVQASDLMSAACAREHDQPYTADNVDLTELLNQLAASRDRLTGIGELLDSQLDAIPPDGSFRFCDGQRNLEQVLASLLKHQTHQVKAVKTAITQPGPSQLRENPG